MIGDATDAVVVIGVLTSSVIAVIGAVFAGLASLWAKKGYGEVKTMNELTLGQLGEASETRRIMDKPEGDRTTRERRHTDAAEERSTGA